MIAAIEPEIPVTEGGVHKGTMMRVSRISMNVGSEMPAVHAHALHRNGVGLLQRVDDLDLP